MVETGSIRRLGAESFEWRVRPGDAAAGRTIKDLGLPREAVVNLIVRGETALPPRGSTEIEAGDELHILARRRALGQVEALTERWRSGPLGEPQAPALPLRGAPQVFTVRPWTESDGDPTDPREINGVAVVTRLRVRRDFPGALLALADGRYAIASDGLLAVGGRRRLAEWAAGRIERSGQAPAERAWWQEVAGVLAAPPR